LNLNGNTDTRAKGAPVIKVKPSDPSTLYIVYAADPDGPGPDEADIFLIRSTDAGNSWSSPFRVNDDATQSDQILPWIYVKPNGVIDICWYDRRNDLSDFDFDIYFTFSTDDGNSFAPNVKVNNVMFPPPFVPKTGDAWIGEYMALTADYYTAYMVHTSSAFDGLGDVIFVTAENPMQNIDRGDAPDPGYPTMALNNGASHDMDGVTWLGTLIDAEPDGIPDASALGDDNLNLDDEDGVVFPGGNILIGTSNSVDVTASANGFLNAWIDFNQDGDWADPNEQIFTDQMLSASVNNLNFNVPATALSGNSFARFRFNTQGGLSFIGHAADGEVEDYMVILENMTDFGDAPDNALAYPGSGTFGVFPTCITGSNPGQYVMHFPSSIWLGPAFDAETDGNAGLCSPFSTPYDSDECFQDNDAGLIIPLPYTIVGAAGQEQVVPCAGNASPLDTICSIVHWGFELDIHVVNNSPSPAYMNVLVDWNQDGLWALNSGTMCNSIVVPEHVLVDFSVPVAYNGALSALGPPSFLSGPNTGYCWSRFTISNQPVSNNWQGSGEFDDGETEDYIMEIALNTDIYRPERQSGSLRMIPNPTTGNASVLFFNPEYGETSLWIYDITGKSGSAIFQEILTKGLHSIAWEGNLPNGYRVNPGFYILEHRLNNLILERIRIVIR
ncbi:MAG: hypothetical protein KKA81_00695, partial [Bacteroidetes bacterium]|nr:hypothetical protein [Bacteroidota bacterium]